MTRRAELPGTAELFRSTSPQPTGASTESPAEPTAAPVRSVDASPASGRQRHEEKITVYCSAEELVALESARLVLRADHGISADRGRIVREALTLALAELAADGAASGLARRLRRAAGPGTR